MRNSSRRASLACRLAQVWFGVQMGALCLAVWTKLSNPSSIEQFVSASLRVDPRTAAVLSAWMIGAECTVVVVGLVVLSPRAWLQFVAVALTASAVGLAVLSFSTTGLPPCGCGIGPDLGAGWAAARNLALAVAAFAAATAMRSHVSEQTRSARANRVLLGVAFALVSVHAWRASWERRVTSATELICPVPGCREARVVLTMEGGRNVVIRSTSTSCQCIVAMDAGPCEAFGPGGRVVLVTESAPMDPGAASAWPARTGTIQFVLETDEGDAHVTAQLW